MNIQQLKDKYEAFRINPNTQKALQATKDVAVAVVTAVVIKAVVFIAVEGTKSLINEINNQVNKN
jgi:hypothetical protein